MSESELDTLLQKAFEQCERLGHPLDPEQKEILRSTLRQETRSNPLETTNRGTTSSFSAICSRTRLEDLTLK